MVPVASIDGAQKVKADFRVGERSSARIAGFDFGNSPTELRRADIPPGSTVVLSTTNGTRVIEAATGARSILTGAFVNAGALADELLWGSHGAEIVVVGCGWEGKRASEDEAAAGSILHRLAVRGAELDPRARSVTGCYLERSTKNLLNNSAARRLRRNGYEQDLEFCLAEDSVPVVPQLVEGAFIAR